MEWVVSEEKYWQVLDTYLFDNDMFGITVKHTAREF